MRRIAILLLLLVIALLAGLRFFCTHNLGPVERGRRLAAAKGCLACHGAAAISGDKGGATGGAAPLEDTRGIGSVPSFGNDDVTAYARSRGELCEWILDGRPRRLKDEAEPAPFLKMPAWRGRLSPAEAGQLVAWIEAASDCETVPEPVAAARTTIAGLGCFACHGPQGRGDTPNPGSLKGYIPSWSGADFPELARDDAEIREWVKDGVARRRRRNPLAADVRRRQAIRMPAFGERVGEDEIQQITAYIRWLRQAPGAEARAPVCPS
jgi:mono/diheme cytochrome c family protein